MDDFIAAAETGDAAALEEILAHFEVKRFQVNDRDRLGYTALHYACSNGREEAVKVLLAHGGDINARNPTKGQTPLHCACNAAHAGVIKLLLARPEIINSINAETKRFKYTPLHCLAMSSKPDTPLIAMMLLKAGGLLDKTDINGNTPLMFACQRGTNVELVKIMLKYGAKANAQDRSGVTAMHMAALGGNHHVVALLAAAGASCTGEMDKNAPLPPLHLAAKQGHAEVCDVLLKNGARADAPSVSGRRALHLAAFGGFVDVVQALLRHQADINAVDADEYTPLAYAAHMGHEDVVECLLKAGAKATIPAVKSGWTPLHLAAKEGHGLALAALLKWGHCNVDATDKQGRTALHFAAHNGDMFSCKQLISSGADVTIVTRRKKTPADMAQARGHTTLASLLASGTDFDNVAVERPQRRRTTTAPSSSRKPSSGRRATASSSNARPAAGPSTRRPGAPAAAPSAALASQVPAGRKMPSIAYLDEQLRNLTQQQVELSSNNGFAEAFAKLNMISRGAPATASAHPANARKNRYRDIVAYDATRVKLSAIGDDPNSDYINANYIDGYKLPRGYIAVQGPLPNTTPDFWRMVWEQGSSVIVMVTALEEGGRPKCHQYWPSPSPSGRPTTAQYGRFVVTLQRELAAEGFVLRHLELQLDSARRVVVQVQMTSWPDHGVPANADSFLAMHSAVRETLDQAGPTGPPVVHCSAGVGRSGTYICLDIVYEMLCAGQEQVIDIYSIVARLREGRNMMVQSLPQFVFLYDACKELIAQMKQTALQQQREASQRQHQHYAAHNQALQQQQKQISRQGPGRSSTASNNSTASADASRARPPKNRTDAMTEAEQLELALAMSLAEQRGPGASRSAADSLPREFELLYTGSQKVKRAAGSPVVNAALSTVLRRGKVSRPLLFRVDVMGVELCELGRRDGMMYPVNLISFFESGIMPADLKPLLASSASKLHVVDEPCFICFITLVEKTGEHVCHCFLTSSINEADDVRMAIAQSIDLAAHVRGLNHVQTPADEETEMQMALAISQSEAEQRQREAEQQELATALAMSASVPMEDSQPASRPARTNPFASSEPEPTPAAAPVAVSTALPDAAANHTTTPAPDPRSYNPFFVPSPVIERKPIAPGSPELRGSPQPGGSPRLRPYRPKQEIVPVDVDADDCAAPDAEEEAPVAPAAPTSADAAPLDADVSVIQVPMATEDLPMRGTNDDDDEMEGPQPSYGAEQEHDDAAELASRAQTLLLGLTPTVAGDVGRVSNTPSGHSLHSAIMQTDSGAPVVTHSAPGSPKVTTLGDSAGTSTPNLTTTLPTEAELKAEAERMVQEARERLKRLRMAASQESSLVEAAGSGSPKSGRASRPASGAGFSSPSALLNSSANHTAL